MFLGIEEYTVWSFLSKPEIFHTVMTASLVIKECATLLLCLITLVAYLAREDDIPSFSNLEKKPRCQEFLCIYLYMYVEPRTCMFIQS